MNNNLMKTIGILRISLGWIFFWPFLNKLGAWTQGVSPSFGYLKNATSGPFGDMFQSMAGNALVDWLYMLGLGLIGLCLVLGIMVRISSFFGIIMMVLIYFSAFPPKSNPFMDQHIIYSLLFVVFMLSNVGDGFGLGKKWKELGFVKSFWIFE